jgi:cytochrome P450
MLANDPDYESDEEWTRDMITFMSAGFDTTAHSIAWALLELGRNPEEQHLLRSALMKNNCSSKEESRQCLELKNVTRETLRLYTPAALGGIILRKPLSRHSCHFPWEVETVRVKRWRNQK